MHIIHINVKEMALPCKLQQTPSYPVSKHAKLSFNLKKFSEKFNKLESAG
jgi:hypothetical protein